MNGFYRPNTQDGLDLSELEWGTEILRASPLPPPRRNRLTIYAGGSRPTATAAIVSVPSCRPAMAARPDRTPRRCLLRWAARPAAGAHPLLCHGAGPAAAHHAD